MSHAKIRVQEVLKHIGVYQRLKASRAYDLYWSFKDRSVSAWIRNGTAFYRGLLSGFKRGCLVFDVGANDGSKTAVFLRLGARVVAVEPDQTNQTIIRDKFLRFRLTPKPVTILGKALSDEVSVATMWIDQPGSATNTLSQKWVETLKEDDARFGFNHEFRQTITVETTTLDNLIAAHGIPFFIKIDVEGHELSVLRGLHSAVPYLSFEVNLPEFLSDAQECVRILDGLDGRGKFNYVSEDYELGLAMSEWQNSVSFSKALSQCNQRTIEVIWKTPVDENINTARH
ncbi:MAG TPA: FkbM family methyltransferase [Candidatus Sulfotelmatobacter sp.]|nr:FkbM family methyltransferase [Candidatus Sulfotelmatobacter sp.]